MCLDPASGALNQHLQPRNVAAAYSKKLGNWAQTRGGSKVETRGGVWVGGGGEGGINGTARLYWSPWDQRAICGKLHDNL